MQAVTGSLLLVFTLLLTACSPEAPVRFADGSFTQSSHWDGRWLVINYWAEWCAPCRDEIPELNELHHARVNHGLVMLGVNWDGLQGEKLTDVIERLEIHGVEMAPLSEARELTVEAFMVDSASTAERPFQDRYERRLWGNYAEQTRSVPAGTMVVSVIGWFWLWFVSDNCFSS